MKKSLNAIIFCDRTTKVIKTPLFNICLSGKHIFSGRHFRLPRFDSPLTTPSEVKINGRRILPVINYYIKTLYSLNVYTQVYTLLSKFFLYVEIKLFYGSSHNPAPF